MEERGGERESYCSAPFYVEDSAPLATTSTWFRNLARDGMAVAGGGGGREAQGKVSSGSRALAAVIDLHLEIWKRMPQRCVTWRLTPRSSPLPPPPL